MVVKNVSGFDLMRMHHGALGTLGVIVSANFKVLAVTSLASELSTTLLDSLEQLAHVRRSHALERTSGRVRGLSRAGRYSTAIRIDGRERTAELLASELDVRHCAAAQILDPDASASSGCYASGFDSSERRTTGGFAASVPEIA